MGLFRTAGCPRWKAAWSVAGLGTLAFSAAWWMSGRVSSEGAGARQASRPSLIMISVDTLRADRLSVYGYTRPTSPVLERLAAEGVVFDSFYYNGGGTLPSHMTLFTSLHPATHGIEPSSGRVLPAERVTLTEVLRAAGYRTGAFVDPGWLNPKYGFAQGFEIYDDGGHRLRANLPKALDWLGTLGDAPFFLFLHTYDVHSTGLGESLPYDCPGDTEWRFVGTPPAGYDGCQGSLCGTKLLRDLNQRAEESGGPVASLVDPTHLATISSLYDGCVSYVDEQIGALVRHLGDAGTLERTILVVLSDHGEEFGEHGRLLHDQGGYEELARIPWIVRLPTHRFAGTRVKGLAAMADVAPTLLELMGLPPIPDAQGHSQVSALGSGQSNRREVHMYSILRRGHYKLFPDEHRLFDLDQDPAEKRNVWAESPEVASALETRVRRILRGDLALARRFETQGPAAGPAVLDEAELQRLRSLGYLR